MIASHIGNSARLWDLESGQPTGPVLEHPDWVLCVAFSPDGRTIATGCKDKVARLWDAATGAPIREAMVHRLPVVATEFSPDGKTLLTGCSDDFCTSGAVCLWDVATRQPLAMPRPFSNGVAAIAFRPDGLAVATALMDGEVSVWPVLTPVGDNIGRLRFMCQTCTGMELRDTVVYRMLSPADWLHRKRELDESDAAR